MNSSLLQRPRDSRLKTQNILPMNAPIYPPSEAYEPPVYLPQELNTTTVSIAALLASPEAKAIVLRIIPDFETRVNDNEGLRAHADNLPASLMVPWGVVDAATMEKLDKELRALGSKAEAKP